MLFFKFLFILQVILQVHIEVKRKESEKFYSRAIEIADYFTNIFYDGSDIWIPFDVRCQLCKSMDVSSIGPRRECRVRVHSVRRELRVWSKMYWKVYVCLFFSIKQLELDQKKDQLLISKHLYFWRCFHKISFHVHRCLLMILHH